MNSVMRLALGILLLSCMLHGPITAAEPIKVMLLDGQNNHNWRETSPVMKEILEDAGIFKIDVVTSPPKKEDMSGFKPNFSAYDVVLLNYTGQSWPQETNTAFIEYVKGGGGVVVVHAANNAFAKWREFNEIIGLGGWGGRNEKSGPYVRYRDGKIIRDMTPGRGGSHGRGHAYLVVHRQIHPITYGLPAEWRHAPDELYDRLRGPALNLSVLATAYSAPDTGGTGEHEPALMTIDYGKGRTFHTIMGHGGKCMNGSPGFKVTLARGTEWAATGAVTQAVPADFVGEGEKGRTGDGWTQLFDGKTLDGWIQRNGTAKYSVVNGTVLGVTNEGSPNSFMCTEKDYSDFELIFEVLVDDHLNSGVQIRSRSTKEFKNLRVHGPQVEIATNGSAGFVYGEGLGTGWLSQKRSNPEARAAFKKGEWNSFRVLAVGSSIKTWVNGVPVANLTDEKSNMPAGFIGLQVHGIKKGTGPYQVQWRNIFLRDLSKK